MPALLLDSSIRITLVIAAAALLLWIFRIRGASARHATWAALTVTMLVMPAIVAWAPGFQLPVLPERDGPIRAPVVLEMRSAPPAAQTPAPATELAPDPFEFSWQALAIGAYSLGVVFFLFRLAAGTWQVHRLLTTSTMDRGRRVHPACTTPITVGWRKPVMILPTTWAEWPEQQLQAVMTHEGEHVRRRDPLVQWVALLNRAIFWFHPLTWWLERELAKLAEEACDEAVLAQGVEAEDYSNALVFLARTAHETGARIQLGTAMPGPALYGRLRSILDGTRPQRISAWRLACLALAIGGTAFLFSAGKLAQAQSTLAFEVATIKPAAPGANGRYLRRSGPGQISITNFNLKEIVIWAYGPRTLTIIGGPKWMDSESPNDSFDIEAKGPVDATPQQMRQMARALLADRFKMKVHTEQKEVPAYALVAARADRKLGPKITESTGKPCESGRSVPADPGMPRCGSFFSPIALTTEGATMKHLADMLSDPLTDLGRPVVDRTNIPGDFKIKFEFTFRMPGTPRPDDGPSIFTALQEQLGLKLENARASIEQLVIDSAERPTEN